MALAGSYKMWVHNYGNVGYIQVDGARVTYMLEATSIPSLLRAGRVATSGIGVSRDGCTMALDPRPTTDPTERFKAMCYSYPDGDVQANYARMWVSGNGINWKTIKTEVNRKEWQMAGGTTDNCPEPITALTP